MDSKRPWVFYSCWVAGDDGECGSWVWQPSDETPSNLRFDKSALSECHKRVAHDDYFNEHHVHSDPNEHRLPYIKHTNYFFYPVSVGSGLMVFHFPTMEKLVLSDPTKDGSYRVLPSPDHIDLSLIMMKGLDDDGLSQKVSIKEHKDGFSLLLAKRKKKSLFESHQVELEMVEIYDSRTDCWRQGSGYLLGGTLESDVTFFQLGDLLLVSEERKRVATYDIELDTWKEYEFYTLLPELDQELSYRVLNVSKYTSSRLLVVAVVCKGWDVKGDILAWSVGLDSPPVQLFKLETNDLTLSSMYIDVEVGEGCIALFFAAKTHLPDVLYDIESRQTYFALNSECRKMALAAVFRPNRCTHGLDKFGLDKREQSFDTGPARKRLKDDNGKPKKSTLYIPRELVPFPWDPATTTVLEFDDF